MANIFGNIKHYWDIRTKRYEVFPATDPADVQSCMQVLEEVRKKELNRVAGASVLDSHAFSGEQQEYILMACRDKKIGAIIGCMRLTPASEMSSVPASREEYSMDSIPEAHLKTLYIFTRLAILKPYRKTPAALVLMAESMVHLVGKGSKGALLACEPNLYAMYQGLGMRPIGPLHNSPSGGYRIPMIFLVDEEHTRAVKSPALPWVKKMGPERFKDINQWFREWYQQYNVYHLGISMLEDAGLDPKVYEVLTIGLSDAGRQGFLKNAMVIQCQENDVLVAEKDGSKSLGIVLDGMVSVVIEGKGLVQLKPGDLFGEIAFVLDTLRTASLVAVKPDTRILMFSASAYYRLDEAADKICFWQNLARVLAQRVLVSNKLMT